MQPDAWHDARDSWRPLSRSRWLRLRRGAFSSPIFRIRHGVVHIERLDSWTCKLGGTLSVPCVCRVQTLCCCSVVCCDIFRSLTSQKHQLFSPLYTRTQGASSVAFHQCGCRGESSSSSSSIEELVHVTTGRARHTALGSQPDQRVLGKRYISDQPPPWRWRMCFLSVWKDRWLHGDAVCVICWFVEFEDVWTESTNPYYGYLIDCLIWSIWQNTAHYWTGHMLALSFLCRNVKWKLMVQTIFDRYCRERNRMLTRRRVDTTAC